MASTAEKKKIIENTVEVLEKKYRETELHLHEATVKWVRIMKEKVAPDADAPAPEKDEDQNKNINVLHVQISFADTWSVSALFYIGKTKAHSPIPEHVSAEAKDLKDLLLKYLQNAGSIDICNMGTLNISTENTDNLSEARNMWRGNSSDDDMCQLDDTDNFLLGGGTTCSTVKTVDDFNKSFNLIAEPSDDWNYDYDTTTQSRQGNRDLVNNQEGGLGAGSSASPNNSSAVFWGPPISEDEDQLTESKIRALLDEKALELKKLQTPLYKEFYNSLNPSYSPQLAEATIDENTPNYLKLPPKSRSPSRGPVASPSTGIDMITSPSPGSSNRQTSCIGSGSNQDCDDSSLQSNGQRQSNNPMASFSEIERKLKEELDQERKREMMRQAGVGGKISSAKDRASN